LWGKLSRATEAARAELLAAESARDTVRNSLTADVVQGYYNLLALDAQIAIAKRTEETHKATLKLQQLRMNAGVSSEFEVRQLEAELATVQAQIPALQRTRTQQENALTVLLGRSPKMMLDSKIETTNAGGFEIKVPAGLPSDLLLRRPDLIQAEQNLVAANARVNVARAAFYPSITLTGFLGGESESLLDLFIGPARIFRFAAELTQPLFGAERIGASVDAAKAREDQLIAEYKQVVANAFREVQDALIAQRTTQEILVAEDARVAALRKALSLAKLRYDNGVASQLEMLDAERNLLQATYDQVDAKRLQRVAMADLFKAMGGGWSVKGEE
jgi:multidrug efflux system outer membrane protein